MTTFKKQFVAAVSAGSMFLTLVGPVGATSVEISGNGAFSDPNATVTTVNSTVVTQTNNAVVTNTVTSSTNTGKNDANFNTGGNNVIHTGNATSTTSIANNVNSNTATVDCCAAGAVDVLVSENGAYSTPDAVVANTQYTTLWQDNLGVVTNTVDAKTNTGKNNTNFNTNGDNVTITGNASTSVDISTTANANVAHVGGNGGNAAGSSVDITGNGAYSDPNATVVLTDLILLAQNNVASIYNDVDAKANTGKNDANYNTSGENVILTGDASVSVEIDNLANFNWAAIDCDCLLAPDVKVSGNGAFSYPDAYLTLVSDRQVYQTSVASLYNLVDDKANTGKNDAEFNTDPTADDALIVTGNSTSTTEVSNTANWNSYGGSMPLWLPELPELDFSFSLSGLSLSHVWHLLAWL